MANKEPRFCAFSDVGKPPRPQRFLPPFRSSNSPGNTRGAAVEKLPCKSLFSSPCHMYGSLSRALHGRGSVCLRLAPTLSPAWPVQPWQLAVERAGCQPHAACPPCQPHTQCRTVSLHGRPCGPGAPDMQSPVFKAHCLSRCSCPKGQPTVLLAQMAREFCLSPRCPHKS